MRKATYALLVISLFLAAGLFAVDKQLFEFGKAATQAEVQAKGNYQLIVQGSNSTPVNIVLTNLKTWVVDGVSPSNVQSYAVAVSNESRTLTLAASNSLRAAMQTVEYTGTNFTGNGGGLTNVTASRLSQHIAAYYVTNTVENRASIYVTSNAASAVNGRYDVQWYNRDLLIGVWTNTASTNIIVHGNPSNSVALAGQSYVISASANPTEFMYFDQDLVGYRDAWRNPFSSDGMVNFSGAATLTWGTNYVRNLVVTSWAVGGTNVGIVATNLMRVSTEGNDETATRLNGYPFKTLYVASTNATAFDLIYLEPGYHKTKPFHMVNRSFHILGAGADVCFVEPDHSQTGPDPFQSRAIIPWDNCSVGGFTLTNGLVALAQFSGTFLGGTNIWVHDVEIYPPTKLKFPDNTAGNTGNGDQSQYFNVGVDVTRIGRDNRIERVKVKSSMRGFNFVAALSGPGEISLIDCEAHCSPEHAGSHQIWTNAAYLGFPSATNVGGMLPLSFTANDRSYQTTHPITVYIQGGKFTSLNGGTNMVSYFGGESQPSRNADLWIAKAYTNAVNIDLSGVPVFGNGNTNTTSFAVLNETTNNNVNIVGYYLSNRIEQVTNTLYQSVHATGTAALSSASQVVMNFGTIDPTLTVIQTSGIYEIKATAAGIMVDQTYGCVFSACSNSVVLTSVTLAAADAALGGAQIPWSVAVPIAYTPLIAGDVVSLQWQSGGTDWEASSASISIVKIK